MLPTSLAIQLDTITSAGIPTARLHGIGSDFVMAVWETAPAASGPRGPNDRRRGSSPPLYPPHRADILGRRAHACGPAPPRRGRRHHLPRRTRHAVATASANAAADFDAALLMSGLDGTARLRVVRLLLDFCRSAFSLQNDPRFASLCRRLILELSPTPRHSPPAALRRGNWCCATAACPPASAKLRRPSC